MVPVMASMTIPVTANGVTVLDNSDSVTLRVLENDVMLPGTYKRPKSRPSLLRNDRVARFIGSTRKGNDPKSVARKKSASGGAQGRQIGSPDDCQGYGEPRSGAVGEA